MMELISKLQESIKNYDCNYNECKKKKDALEVKYKLSELENTCKENKTKLFNVIMDLDLGDPIQLFRYETEVDEYEESLGYYYTDQIELNDDLDTGWYLRIEDDKLIIFHDMWDCDLYGYGITLEALRVYEVIL